MKSAKPDGFHPVHKALSDKVGTDTLNLGGISLTNSLLRRDGDSGFSEQIATDTLDRFCEENEISEIDILKVDVEGAEMRVFRGAQEMFERAAVRAVFVEVYFVETYEGMPLVWDLHEFLMGQGFHLRNLYSPFIGQSKCLSFANALYLQPDLIK